MLSARDQVLGSGCHDLYSEDQAQHNFRHWCSVTRKMDLFFATRASAYQPTQRYQNDGSGRQGANIPEPTQLKYPSTNTTEFLESGLPDCRKAGVPTLTQCEMLFSQGQPLRRYNKVAPGRGVSCCRCTDARTHCGDTFFARPTATPLQSKSPRS